MSTEIQKLPAQGTHVAAVVNFFDPNQFAVAQRMSKMFATSKLVPVTYQTSEIYTSMLKDQQKLPKDQQLAPKDVWENAELDATANCMIAIDIATRIGASPMAVMQNMTPIYGKPSWSSKFLIATVNTCGRFEPLKFRFTEKGKLGKFNYTEYSKQWVDNPNGKGYYKNTPVTKEFDGTKIMDIECVAYTTAKGSKDTLEGSPISLRMAIDEGWYVKNGSKWQTMPRQMLMYRAASFWTSVYAPELSMGMRTIEEAQDFAEYEEVQEDDVAMQVEHEKQQNANKETIGFDVQEEVAANPSGNVPGNVDAETGEVMQDADLPDTEIQESRPVGNEPNY